MSKTAGKNMRKHTWAEDSEANVVARGVCIGMNELLLAGGGAYEELAIDGVVCVVTGEDEPDPTAIPYISKSEG